MSRLSNGDAFPTLTLPRVGGGTVVLPQDLAGSFGVVLVYRGAWCPYCNAQLASFQRALDSLTQLNVRVVALSVDDEAASEELVEKHRLRFPVAHSADPAEVATATGAYLSEDGSYLQSTGFVLAPDGSVLTAVYSSAAIGRLVPADVSGFVTYLQKAA